MFYHSEINAWPWNLLVYRHKIPLIFNQVIEQSFNLVKMLRYVLYLITAGDKLNKSINYKNLYLFVYCNL